MRSIILSLCMLGVAGVAAPLSAQSDVGDPVFSLPLGVGLRIPSYDRVNGLSLPWGPVIRIPGGRVQIDPIITYRSNLGEVDPSGRLRVAFGRFDSLDVYAGRGTFTNDAWIRSDLINSLAAIGVGSDARNYFRADRVTAELGHSFRSEVFVLTPSIGALHELAWSTGIHGPDIEDTKAPWSIFGRTDELKMRRPNPGINSGHVTSGLAGVRGKYERDDLTGSFSARVEHSFDEPASDDDGHFTQTTLDARTNFPTFGLQSFEFRGHAVTTSGTAPAQRFAYLGGAGTLSTVDLLALGGDRLVFVEGEYHIPLVRPLLPFVGAPVITFGYAAGSAGVQDLPDFIQNISVGLGVKLVKVKYSIDPSYRKTAFSDKSAFTIGFSLSL
jgi:hypothetical protein